MNTVQLEGNLARDIEISFTKSGMAVARGSVACNRRVKDGNEWKDVIRQLLGSEGYRRYCEGNVIKYLYRYTRKGTPATDIAKAAEYLRMIAEEEAREQ